MSSGDAEVAALLAEWARAEQVGDTTVLDACLADEFVGMGPLGFTLSKEDWLQRFANGLHYDEFSLDDTRMRGYITTKLAVAWATQTSQASSDEVNWSRRLMVVRIFARHLKTLDPATEIPPDDALPHHYRRIPPYLYSPAEIDSLMTAAGRLGPPLRADRSTEGVVERQFV